MAEGINYVNNKLYIECQENLDALDRLSNVFHELHNSKPNFNLSQIANCYNFMYMFVCILMIRLLINSTQATHGPSL